MLQAINTWNDYKARVREYDAVLEHGKAVATALAGVAAATPEARQGLPIHAKLIAHANALRGLAPSALPAQPMTLQDVPSMSALARCVVEAHDAFEYVAGHDITPTERAFRIRLWELHDRARQLKMHGDLGPAEPRIDALRDEVARLTRELLGHAFLDALGADLQAVLRQRLAQGDPPAFHLTQRQRCVMSGVDAQWHHAVTTQLALQAHTLPSSVGARFAAPVDSPEALRLLALPLLFALPFLARATQAAAALVPERAPVPPSRTARTMAAWRARAAASPAPG